MSVGAAEQAGAARVRVAREVFDRIEAVRRGGQTNMIDRRRVADLAEALGFDAAARWVREDRDRYARAVFHGLAVDAPARPFADELWISRSGELACIHHVPHPAAEASDTGLWRRLARDEAEEIADETEAAPHCWTCDRIEQREEEAAARGC